MGLSLQLGVCPVLSQLPLPSAGPPLPCVLPATVLVILSEAWLFCCYCPTVRERDAHPTKSMALYIFPGTIWRNLSNKSGVPNLWDLMPDDLRWSWGNNHRNKVHGKCNALESSWNHPSLPWFKKNLSSMKLVLVPKRLGTTAVNLSLKESFLGSLCLSPPPLSSPGSFILFYFCIVYCTVLRKSS